MISLLKTFGKGLLYVVGAPFFIVALLLFGVIGLGAFIFQIIKSIIYFFIGQKFFPELPEDKKLRLMKEAASKPEEPIQQDNNMFSSYYEEDPEPEPAPAPIFIERETTQPTIEETVFEDASSLEDLIEEEIVPESTIDETEEEEEETHTILETGDEPESNEIEEEVLETYVPRSSTYSDIDEDENDTDTGVDINYDL